MPQEEDFRLSSRKPQSQNRSGTASPSQQPKQDNKPAPNVWTQRAANNNGPIGLHEEPHTSVNGFNSAEVKAFLNRQPAVSVYKPQDGRASGGAWGAKANHMANGQPFFVQLSKQVAAFQEGV